MTLPSIQSVDDYIASQPTAVQPTLERVRRAVRKALRGAEEVISYNMPTYKLQGNVVLSLAAWGQHYALYGCTAGVLIAFKGELAPYDVIKGTIRFP